MTKPANDRLFPNRNLEGLKRYMGDTRPATWIRRCANEVWDNGWYGSGAARFRYYSAFRLINTWATIRRAICQLCAF